MNVLGIDTSTAACAACVLRSDGEAFEAEQAPEALLGPPAHARELMPAAAGCLSAAGLGWRELDAIAVGIGPGGFTGLRIGVSTARALAGALGLELRAVSSLRALAEGSPEPARLALIDARRGEVYAALYEGGDELIGPFAASPEDVATRVLARGAEPLAVGDGALRYRQVFEAAGLRVAPDGSPAHSVRGLSISRLAVTVRPGPPEAVLPDYQRLPDATPSAR